MITGEQLLDIANRHRVWRGTKLFIDWDAIAAEVNKLNQSPEPQVEAKEVDQTDKDRYTYRGQ